MKNRNIPIVILYLLLFVSIKANGALTMAYVPISDNGFWSLEYNCAKIRQACIAVHGERWFKDNIILARKYCGGSIWISNDNFMAISCKRADPKDLMDLKAVVDYMASCNDTLYIGLRDDDFERIYNNAAALDGYLSFRTSSCFSDSLFAPLLNCIIVGESPDISNPDLIVARFTSFYLGNDGVAGEDGLAYKQICEKDGYMNLNDWRFEKEKVTERDIDLYYDFTAASDKRFLETRPRRMIPIDVHYDAIPNEEGLYIKWEYRHCIK